MNADSKMKELELTRTLMRKLQAMRSVNQLIFRTRMEDWNIEDLCRLMTSTGAYSSCWIALVDSQGTLFEHSTVGTKINKDSLQEFVSGQFKSFQAVTPDPVRGIEFEDSQSVTCPIHHGDITYGYISITCNRSVLSEADNVSIISEIAENIGIVLYEHELENRQAELKEIVRSLEKSHRTVFETTGNPTCVFEEDMIISHANTDFEKLSGYTIAEIEGKKKWTEFIHEDHVSMMMEYHRLRRIDPDSAPRNYYFKFIDRHQNLKDIYMTISVIPGTKKSIASFTDITEHKRLENMILDISETERREIGNDLHDGLGPHLVGVKFLLNLLKQTMTDKKYPEAKKVDEISDLIDQAISQTRMLVKGLCPVDIDTHGLYFALNDIAEGIEKIYDISCIVYFNKELEIEDNTVATQLYYIALEAMNNAVKHAKPDKISVTFEQKSGSQMLTITDDGKGIDLPDKTDGMGITIMKYRARLIHSLLDVVRNDSGGTSVICVIQDNK